MLRPDVDELIAFLDSLAKIDPVAMGALVNSRAPCNEKLAKHQSVQVGATDCLGGYEVGILGVLNGYGGTIEGGKFLTGGERSQLPWSWTVAAQGSNVRCREMQVNLDLAKSYVIASNHSKDSSYNPYCGRCPGLERMKLVEPFLWRHYCGAIHDERQVIVGTQTGDAPVTY